MVRFLDTTLSSPILLINATRLAKALSGHLYTKELRRVSELASYLLSRHPELSSGARVLEVREYSGILAPKIDDKELRAEAQARLLSSSQLIAEVARDLERGIATRVGPGLQGGVRVAIEGAQPLVFQEITITKLSHLLAWEDALYQAQALALEGLQESRRCPRLSRLLGREVLATQDVYLIGPDPNDSGNSGTALLTHDMALMFKDAIGSQFLIHSHIDLLTCHPRPHGAISHAMVEKVVDWSLRVLDKYGNPGYEIVKGIESITKAALVHRYDPLISTPTPLDRMSIKYQEKERTLGGSGEFTAELESIALDPDVSLGGVSELFGLQKLVGHPQIDPSLGGASAQDHGTRPDTTLPSSARILRNHLCHMITRNYIRATGWWPPVHFSEEGRQTRLFELHRRHDLDIGSAKASYPVEDWDHVRFGQFCSWDDCDNYLELMLDRSIAYPRSTFDAGWKEEDLGYKPPRAPTSRRLLVELLLTNGIRPEEVVVMVEQGRIPLDWLVVALYPKEREMKRAPRAFSMMVREMRTLFCQMEHNLARGIMAYLPEQTMTKSRLSTMKLFLEITHPLESSDLYTRVNVEIDLERWNLLWRELVVSLIGADMDDIHGRKGLYTYVHRFFSSCMVYVRVDGTIPEGLDKDNRKNPPLSPELWGPDAGKPHLGGFEGIAQKLWTIITLAMISMAAAKVGVEFTLLGQGDNQVLSFVLRYTRPGLSREQKAAEVAHFLSRILPEIEKAARSVFQSVKPEECLESTSVITYGKEIWVDGVYQPTGIKLASRLFPTTSTDFPSFSASLGSIFSGALAASERSSSVVAVYKLALLAGDQYVISEMNRSLMHGTKIRNATAWTRLSPGNRRSLRKWFLTLPSSLGGFPVLTLLDFMYRGGADKLTDDLTSLWLFCQSNPLYRRYSHYLTLDRAYHPKPNLDTLVIDPFSIPLKLPRHPGSVLQASTLEFLDEVTENRDIRQLLDAGVGGGREALMAGLTSARPFYPKALHDIFAESPAGLIEKFAAMFTQTRTVQAMRTESQGSSITQVLDTDLEGILARFLVWTSLKTLPEKDPTWSAYQLGVELRDRWTPGEKDMVQGVSAIHPLEALHVDLATVDTLNLTPTAEAVILTKTTSTDPRYTRGPILPYLGSATVQKKSDYGARLENPSPGARAAMKLLLIQSQLSLPESHLYSLLDRLVAARCSVDLNLLKAVSPKSLGGHPAHRYITTLGGDNALLNAPPNVASHYLISTDHAGRYAGGDRDYALMFQTLILSMLFLCNLWIEGGEPGVASRPHCIVGTFTCQDILQPLPEDSMEIQRCEPSLPSFVGNPLVHTSVVKLRHLTDVVPAGDWIKPLVVDFDKPSLVLVRRGIRQMVVDALLSSRITYKHLLGSSDMPDPTRSLDVAEIRRVRLRSLLQASAEAILSVYLVSEVGRWGSLPAICRSLIAIAWVAGQAGIRTYSSLLLLPDVVLRARMELGERFGSGMGPRGLEAVESLLLREIGRRVETVLKHPRHTWWTSPEILLSGTTTQLPLQTLALVLLRRGMGEALAGAVTLDSLKAYLREAITLVKVEATTASDLVHLYDRALNPRVRAQDRLDRLQLCVSVPVTQREVLRSLRRLPLIPIPIPAAPRPLPEGKRAMWVRFPLVQVSSRSYLQLETAELTAIDYEYQWKEHRDRTRGLWSTAHYKWVPALDGLDLGSVLVVGCGAGGINRSVSLLGGTSQGLDLISAFPLIPHRFLSLAPPAVLGDPSFSVHPAVWTNGGDWFDPVVQDAVLSASSTRSLLVVDIELGGDNASLRVLHSVLKLQSRSHSPALCKVLVSRSEAPTLLLAVQSLSRAIRFTPLCRHAASWEIAVLIPPMTPFHTLYYPNVPPSLYLDANAALSECQLPDKKDLNRRFERCLPSNYDECVARLTGGVASSNPHEALADTAARVWGAIYALRDQLPNTRPQRYFKLHTGGLVLSLLSTGPWVYWTPGAVVPVETPRGVEFLEISLPILRRVAKYGSRLSLYDR